MPFTVAIVGRPNVGKSTLFNRLVGRRKAIVYNRPGVTRDRNEGIIDLDGQSITLIDTGGFEENQEGSIEKEIQYQIEDAMKQADLLVWVVDAKVGVHPLDQSFISTLRKSDTPIIMACNKVDPGTKNLELHVFMTFGIHTMVPISAEHGLGVGDLQEKIVQALPQSKDKNSDLDTDPETDSDTDQPIPDGTIQIALVGRPNVGKSSMINALIDEHRLAVSDIAGTTRDMIDVSFERQGQKYVFLDTAGLRYKRKVHDDVEYFSVKRTFEAIDQADVVLLVLSGTDGLTTQEEKIAAQIIKNNKPLAIFVNKWDLCERGDTVKHNFRLDLYANAMFLSFADVFFVSALKKIGLEKIFSQAKHLYDHCYKPYEEEDLINAYKAISNHHTQVGRHGHFLELKRLTAHLRRKQSPVFKVKCNNPKWVTASYRKYWKNALTDFFRLRGVPIDVKFRQK